MNAFYLTVTYNQLFQAFINTSLTHFTYTVENTIMIDCGATAEFCPLLVKKQY